MTENTPTVSRRSLLKAGAAATAVGVAGCIAPPPTSGGGAGPIHGGVAGGSHAMQDLTENDTDYTATTTGQLLRHIEAADGRSVWLPPGNHYDYSGRDLTLTNITIASGRNKDQMGAIITTTDQGASSPAWNGGNGTGFITAENNVRITGVGIKGPHTNVTDHPVISGYFPFAPGGESAREQWRRARFARGIAIYGNNVTIDNCDIWGFGVQGISVGSNGNPPQGVEIRYCSITNCMMTSYGYGVDVRHGHPVIYRCYFDATRHSICGSGMGDCGYSVIECTFGPWTTSHQIDQHRVGNNGSGSSNPSDIDYRYRAGNMMYVKGCTIIPTRVPDLPFINHNRGGSTPHVHIRGVPKDGLYFEGNTVGHHGPDAGVEQSGIPGEYQPDGNGYVNINIGPENTWGVQFPQMQQVP